MVRILLVDDGKVIPSVLKKKIENELHFTVDWVQSYSKTVTLIEKKESDFLAALVCLYLPDAPDGEIVDYVISKKIPTIVFTGEINEKIREKIWSKKVVDYVFKEGGHNIDYIISLVRRLNLNRFIKILVVDDSRLFRTQICDLLKIHLYNVLEARNGAEALKALGENPDIKMVITDYNMPEMDGSQLTWKIREKFSKQDLAIIGISGDNTLSSRFIKIGANDFINKEFFSEEFYCRITQNIENIEHIAEIRDASNKDYLTGLFNRRYFFDLGSKLFANAKRMNMKILAAMIDIDYFKHVNDKYGHDAGDDVLKAVSDILKFRFRETDIVARFGGEEFCILASNMNDDQIFTIFDNIRKKIESTDINIRNNKLNITVSIGICNKLPESLNEMIKEADTMLYQAKTAGRNKVLISE